MSFVQVLVLVLGLALTTFILRGTGPGLRAVPEGLARRTAGLAPALLAALVITQMVSSGSAFRPDVRAAAVVVAAGLAALRAPLLASVVAGAAVAAGLRLLLHT